MRAILVSMITVFLGISSFAAEREKVKLDEIITVDGKTLLLNGRLALRKVHKFGIPVKVYVGGLYLETKSSDAAEILKSPGIKRFVMHYVRGVDRDALLDAFRGSFEATCEMNCDKKGEQFRPFGQNIVSIRENNLITLTFYPTKVEIDSTGPNAKKATIEGADLSHNLLAMYVSEKTVAGKEFRADILGLEVSK